MLDEEMASWLIWSHTFHGTLVGGTSDLHGKFMLFYKLACVCLPGKTTASMKSGRLRDWPVYPHRETESRCLPRQSFGWCTCPHCHLRGCSRPGHCFDSHVLRVSFRFPTDTSVQACPLGRLCFPIHSLKLAMHRGVKNLPRHHRSLFDHEHRTSA